MPYGEKASSLYHPVFHSLLGDENKHACAQFPSPLSFSPFCPRQGALDVFSGGFYTSLKSISSPAPAPIFFSPLPWRKFDFPSPLTFHPFCTFYEFLSSVCRLNGFSSLIVFFVSPCRHSTSTIFRLCSGSRSSGRCFFLFRFDTCGDELLFFSAFFPLVLLIWSLLDLIRESRPQLRPLPGLNSLL